MNILNIENVSKSYSEFQLNNINMNIKQGTIMGLVGPNGSGKTTTIKLVLNMLKRNQGKIEIFGKDNIKWNMEINQEIGVVFDSNFFVDDWKAVDVDQSVGIFYKHWSKERFYSLLDSFNISKVKKVAELSKGMQMKLMLACALSHDAKLLILDEPTSGLDPVSRDELMQILKQYIADGQHSVLFSTHITSDLDKIAEYITFINYGNLVFSGLSKEFIKSYAIATGPSIDLSDCMKKEIIGKRSNGSMVEVLIPATVTEKFQGFEIRDGNIEDIVVLSSKRSENYE